MTRPLEGIDTDDCRTLRDAVADTNSYVDEARSELRDELQKDDPDEDRIEEITESLDEIPHLNDRLSRTLTSACGIGFYPTEDGDPNIGSDDLDTWHRTVDEMNDDVAETVPGYLVQDDIGFHDDSALEFKKQSFFDKASRTKDAIEDVAEARGYDDDYDRNDRNPVGPMVVVCPYEDPEKKRECIERRTDGEDVNWNGVSRTGETYG